MSGILMSPDSVAVPDVAIIDIHSGKTVRTNVIGFFQTEMAADDSLMIYHIAYKKQFITADNNARMIILTPEVQEIMQVDITNQKAREQKNLMQTVADINRLAPLNSLWGYDAHSRQDYFILDNGSHTKGFSPFFGPTISMPIDELAAKVSKIKERRQLRKLTSHYHLVKNGDQDEDK